MGKSTVATTAVVLLAVATGSLVTMAMRSTPDLPPSAVTYTVPTSSSTTAASTSLAAARALLAERRPLTISVLGDSTGDDPVEWVRLTADRLAKTRTVVLHHWNDGTLAWDAPVTLGDGGSTVTIWNFSAAGRPAAYPADKIAMAQPKKPDLVIYSHGHNNKPSNIEAELNQTRDAVVKRWAGDVLSVATVQNPEQGKTEANQYLVRETVRGWATVHHYAVIDVAAAFLAQKDYAPLMRDLLHPNEKGSAIWAGVVAKALALK